jgi:hypothetical protein
MTKINQDFITKYLFISNFTRDFGFSGVLFATIVGSSFFILKNYEEFRTLFLADLFNLEKTIENEEEIEEENEEFIEKIEEESKKIEEPKSKGWFF